MFSVLLLAACSIQPAGEVSPPERDVEVTPDSGTGDTAEPGDSGDSGTSPIDADSDGFTQDEDCDDADAGVYPGAAEIAYDGVDQDCDGADANDLDGDGSAYPEDCDDGDPSRGTTVAEVSADGIDQDCDGYVDIDAMTLADVSLVIEGTDSRDEWTGPRDGFGTALTLLGDLDGDGLSELGVTADYTEALVLDGARVAAAGGTIALNALDPIELVMSNASVTAWSAMAIRPGPDLDAGGAADLWVGVEPHRGDEVSAEWRLVPSTRALGAEPWIDAGDGPQVLAPEYGTGVSPEGWVADQDLDGDGLDDLCVQTNVLDAFPMPYAICCVSASSLGPTPLAACDDADGQVGSQSEAVAYGLYGLGDLDGDGLDGIAGDGGQQYLFDGDDLLSGGAVEALSVVDITLDTYYAPRSVTVLPDADGDGGTELLLVHPDNVEHDGTTVEGFAAVWTDLDGGGVRDLASATTRIFADYAAEGGSYHQVTAASNLGALRAEGEGDVMFATKGGAAGNWLAPLALEDLLAGGEINLADANGGLSMGELLLAETGYLGELTQLLLLDIDRDGDDDVITASPWLYQGLSSYTPSVTAGGALTVFLNPR